MTLDPEICWRAWSSRDRRFEGRFFAAVTSTGIYCRPGCPARMPARRNVRFYDSAAAAEAAGFRPCLRCRPETTQGSPAAQGTTATVARALRLIEEGGLDEGSVESLAGRLGVTSRWLRELFTRQVGASPLEVAMTRRVHFARRLLDETPLPLADVAAASGFASARRLRHAIQATFRRPPSALRRAPASRASSPLGLRVPARAPFDAAPILAFLAARAIPGVEQVEGRRYRRTSRLGGAGAIVELEALPGAAHVLLRVPPLPPRELPRLVSRVTRLFDLDADSAAIAGALAHDAALRAAVRRGVRVPGAWDAFELAVRALLGQQVSVAAARTLAGRLVQLCGTPLAAPASGLSHLFPDAALVATARLETLGLPRARAASLRAFAAHVADGRLDLEAAEPPDALRARLVALPGIGEWTAQYVAMRALREPDAFPAGDLGVRRALARGGRLPSARETAARAESWRPWRAYATVALWNHEAALARPRKERP
ncbi:MAG TPA: Ada metal-binding domain-containing protein [Candidatus Acidoferrales bacterium]|nr:Ada metal-binding domain-containing protein [Candidatus Acidoferrales bacterium]